MKRAVSGIMLTLLILTSTLILAFKIQPVKAEWTGTVYIRADGSIDPPDAPIQRDGNVYTLTGNIASSADGIVVERDNIVIDGSGYTVRGAGSGGGIDISYRINVKIKNTIVTGFGAGIITDFSSSCTLFCNIVTGNLIGLHLWQSYNNTLYSNNINSNQYNFGVSGWEFSHYLHNIDVSNLVDGKPVFYLKNQKNLVITPFTYPHIGYLALINSTNIKIENLTMMNNVDGLLLVNTKYSTVINCIVTNNLYGIALSCSSNNNTLSGNIVTNNEYGGIYLRLSSNNNKLLSNKIADNWSGVFIYRSSNNSLTENNIAKNNYGFYLENSSNNYIYHNNFVENTIHIYSYYSINVWDDGYPSRGNYWSDYMGVDEKSGPNQDQPGSDGIGDTPYIIDSNNTDRYPLMKPSDPRMFAFAFPRTSLFNVGNVEFYLPELRVEGSVSVDGDGYVKIDVRNFNAGLYANTLRIGSVRFSFQWRIIRAEGGEENTLPMNTHADANDWLYVGEMIVTVKVGDLESWSKRFNFTIDLTKLERQAEEFYEWVIKILDALDKAQTTWDLIQAILSIFRTTKIPVIITFHPDLIMKWLPDSLNPWGQWGQYSAVYAVACPANLYITSPSGLSIGTNYNGEEVNQNPNSYYSGKNVDPQIIWLFNASIGNYQVNLIGTQNGSTTCGVALITPTNISITAIQIEISQGQIIHLESTLSPETLTIPESPSPIILLLLILTTLINTILAKRGRR